MLLYNILWLLSVLMVACIHIYRSRMHGCSNGHGYICATGPILSPLTTVRVMRSISCLSLVLCCLKGLWLQI